MLPFDEMASWTGQPGFREMLNAGLVLDFGTVSAPRWDLRSSSPAPQPQGYQQQCAHLTPQLPLNAYVCITWRGGECSFCWNILLASLYARQGGQLLFVFSGFAVPSQIRLWLALLLALQRANKVAVCLVLVGFF